MKRILLLLIALMLTANAHAIRTFTDSALILGPGIPVDIDFAADVDGVDNPKLRYNHTSDKWTLSNDGTTFDEIATEGYVDTAVAAATIPDATTSVKGKVKLAGDLAGTADLPTVPGLTLKAPLASPPLTGTPTAPTATAGTNTTQIATTAFVATAGSTKADDSLVVHKAGTETITGDKTYTGQITATSTTKGNLNCPVMTDTDMLAIASPRNADCVYNSTKKGQYVYSSVDVKWKPNGGAGAASTTGVELMLDPSFEDGVTADYTGLSGATVSQVNSTLPGTYNEKMMQVAFTATGLVTFNKTTGAGFTGATAKVGGWFYPVTRSDVFVEPAINGVADGRQCALAVAQWTYCQFEIPAHLGPGFRLNSPTSATHNVYVEKVTISIDQKFSALINLSNLSQTITRTFTRDVAVASYTGALTTDVGDRLLSYNSTTGVFSAIRDLCYVATVNASQKTASLPILPAVSGVSQEIANSSSGTAGSYASATNEECITAGQSFVIRNYTNTSNFDRIIIVATAKSTSVVTNNDIRSTNTMNLHWSGTVCSISDVGCYNTYTYATSSNTKVICATRPTQTDADMNTNGLHQYAKNYSGAASTCALPTRIETMFGSGMRGWKSSIYQSAGKTSPGSLEYSAITSVVEIGAVFNYYDAKTGFFVVDLGFTQATSGSSNHYLIFDNVGSSTGIVAGVDGYVVIEASTNPMYNGQNTGIVSLVAQRTAVFSVPDATSTKIPFETVNQCINCNYNINGTFTVSVEGIHVLNCFVPIASSVAITNLVASIDVVGSITKSFLGSRISGSTGTVGSTAGGSIYLRIGDTVSCSMFQDNATNVAQNVEALNGSFSVTKGL